MKKKIDIFSIDEVYEQAEKAGILRSSHRVRAHQRETLSGSDTEVASHYRQDQGLTGGKKQRQRQKAKLKGKPKTKPKARKNLEHTPRGLPLGAKVSVLLVDSGKFEPGQIVGIGRDGCMIKLRQANE